MTFEIFLNLLIGAFFALLGAYFQYYLSERTRKKQEAEHKKAIGLILKATIDSMIFYLQDKSQTQWSQQSFWDSNKIEFARFYPSYVLRLERILTARQSVETWERPLFADVALAEVNECYKAL